MMERSYLFEKATATLTRITLATRTKRAGALPALTLRHVVLARMLARGAMEAVLKAEDSLRAAKRAVKKAQEAGVDFTLAEAQIAKLEADYQKAHREQIELGWVVMDALDVWQASGATLRELCNLCNRDYEQFVAKRVELKKRSGLGKWEEEDFSALVCAYNLDYKNPQDTGWVDERVDAPLTHTTKEYLLDLMLHTEEGRKASHEALVAVFPEIMENALTVVTDPDGVKRVFDKDGVETGTFGEEE